MIFVLLPFFLGFLGCEAQTVTIPVPSCTVSSQNWATNNEGQSPCLVATALINACSPESPTDLMTLNNSQNSYNPPPRNSANACTCSSVTYSMVSACAICQGGLAGTWTGLGTKSWIANCPANVTSLTFFPQPVPSGVFIPTWAFLNVTANGDFFSADTAEQLANEHQPDVTTGVDPLPSSTTNAPSSSGTHSSSSGSSSAANQTSPPAQGHSKTNGGVIAGAVVGSLVGVACIVLVVFFYIRYRNERKPRRHYEGNYEKKEEKIEPGLMSGSTTQSTMAMPVTSYAPLKLYDPEDPSTFPTQPLSALIPTSPSGASTFTHSRNISEDTTINRVQQGHSREPSSDTTSIQSSMTGNGTVGRTPNTPNGGYNPSGVIHRTIPE